MEPISNFPQNDTWTTHCGYTIFYKKKILGTLRLKWWKIKNILRIILASESKTLKDKIKNIEALNESRQNLLVLIKKTPPSPGTFTQMGALFLIRTSKSYFTNLSPYAPNFVLKLFSINIESTRRSLMGLHFAVCHEF